jgi:hypothetical protein
MNEIKPLLISVLKRYGRAFVAGSISSMLSLLAMAQLNPEVLKDPHTLVYSLCVGALTGGLMSLDKLIRFQPPT